MPTENLTQKLTIIPSNVEISDGGTGIEIEDVESADFITEPFNPTKIRIGTKFMSVDLLLSRIEDKALILTPDFQRNVVWTKGVQSRLIESLLIRIPLPVFYIDATNNESWLVIDGLQRLTALKHFVLDKTLKLNELEFLTQYNGKSYNELPLSMKRRIKEAQITVYAIEPGTSPNVKFNIFKRVNTGGLPLSAQEIRHALNQGPVTQFLVDLAKSKGFQRATYSGVRDTRMADREMILRFLAFVITPYTAYKTPNFDAFLNEKMAELNKMPESKRANLEFRFIRAMEAAYAIFKEDAFRKRYDHTAKRSYINKALFESWSVNLDKLNDQHLTLLKKRRERVKDEFINLINDNNNPFNNAISQGTGSVAKVKTRFSEIEKLIRKVLS